MKQSNIDIFLKKRQPSDNEKNEENDGNPKETKKGRQITLSSLPMSEITKPEKPLKVVKIDPKCVVDGVEIELCPEQVKVVEAVLSGRNVFFTGSAGVGKSLTLKVVIDKLRELHGKEYVFVTASTGVAACNLNGTTLHSFAGAGLGNGTLEQAAKKIACRPDALSRWRNAKVLIVDEISMITNHFFELLDKIGRRFRGTQDQANKTKFFGGIQVVFCGDFCQLGSINDKETPVQSSTNNAPESWEEAIDMKQNDIYLFESPLWQKMFPFYPGNQSNSGIMIHLTQIYRQKDEQFVSLLQACRLGNPSPLHIDLLWKRVRVPLDTKDGIRPTRLYPHKADVQQENMLELGRLKGEIRTYRAVDKGIAKCMELLNEHCPALSEISLKLNAQVVLLRNLDFSRGLVNGSRGVVSDFLMGDHNMPYVPVVTFSNGEKLTISQTEWKLEQGKQVLASRKQIPLALCWATTIHKSMGQTLSKVETRLASVFAYGQAYTSLSRCTSLEGVSLLDFDPKKIMANQKVVQFYRQIDEIEKEIN